MSRPPSSLDSNADAPPDSDLAADTRALAAEPDSVELAAFASLAEQLDPKAAPQLSPGTILADSFEIEQVLGAGGMGIVYRAHDLKLGRPVALKLHRPMARGTERLMREAASMAQLTHPNVATVHEVGTHEGMLFIAMEFIDGVTARRWVTDAERTPRQIVALYHAAGLGLAAAHRAGIIHRDFKPENVLVGPDDVPRVVDFGLARSIADAVQPTISKTSERSIHPGSVTLTGAVAGTPAYMAPEQWSDDEIDVQADQFSFCVALYEAVYGERPFAGGSSQALLLAMAKGELRPAPARTAVPAKLRRILVRGLAIEPQQRWPSMEALLEQLERLIAPGARRWVLPSLLVGLAGLGGGLALGQRAEPPERCADANEQLAAIWDETRRAEAKAAILGTGLSYAPDTWARVEQQLDDYALAWGRKYTEICEASPADPLAEQDRQLRFDCMRSRSRALRATVDQLAQADAEVVERAVALASGLPGFDRCDDLDALRAAIPPPEDPTVRQQVDALRERLADIDATHKAGKYAQALEAVEPVLTEAEALGYGPVLAEAKVRRGSLHESVHRLEDAERDLREGYEASIEHRHDDMAFQAARALASVVGTGRLGYAEGKVWGGVALAHARRSNNETQVAIGLHVMGTVLQAQGEYDQAQSHYERSIQIEERILGPDHPKTVYALEGMGNVLQSRGHYDSAQRYYERVLRIREASLGPDHPHTAAILGNLGNLLHARGEFDEAVRYHERASEIWQAALGPDHVDVGLSLGSLGNVLYARGSYDAALDHYQRALEIITKTLGGDHPNVAATVDNIGRVLQAQGEYAQAQPHHERAVEIREKVLGENHPALSISLHNLGLALAEQGKREQAQVRFERALQIMDEALGSDHPNLAPSLGMLGRLHAERGAYDDARRYFERALRITEKAKGSDHPDVARALSLLATVSLDQHDVESARAFAERALSIREAKPGPPGLLAKSRFTLARALWSDQGQRARARALAEQARDGATPDDRAAIDQWLASHDAQ